jgi:hypothetical protein
MPSRHAARSQILAASLDEEFGEAVTIRPWLGAVSGWQAGADPARPVTPARASVKHKPLRSRSDGDRPGADFGVALILHPVELTFLRAGLTIELRVGDRVEVDDTGLVVSLVEPLETGKARLRWGCSIIEGVA